MLSLTGAASTFATWIMAAGEKSLFLSLLLTMVICIVLGTGIPTIPNYIITAAIAAPRAGRYAVLVVAGLAVEVTAVGPASLLERDRQVLDAVLASVAYRERR